MITIITGNINDHKTTKAYRHFLKDRKGDGVLSVKIMDHHQVLYYEAFHLQSNQKKVLCYHEKHQQVDFKHEKIGPYGFIPETQKWVENLMIHLIEQKVEPLYLDEIGVLELEGHGFHSILKRMLESQLDLVLVMRKPLIERWKQMYQVEAVTIIE